jgi:hypothetical protein
VIDRYNDRAHVAWDIETTGFGYAESLTVVGFWFPSGHATLVLHERPQTPADTEFLEGEIADRTDGVDVSVRVAEDNQEMLSVIGEVLFERFEREYNRLVAFNAESWKGGFDLPFLRAVSIRTNHQWVFDGIQFADLYDPLEKRINTTIETDGTSADSNTLTGSHALLSPSQHTFNALSEYVPEDHRWYTEHPYDPFYNSANAVYTYRQDEYLPVLLHNLADIHRTWELGELVRHYVSAKDITTKKL